jgi:hypothetical protein
MDGTSGMAPHSESEPIADRGGPPASDRPIPAVNARQGIITGRVSLVLAVSLALVIVAFALIYTLHS